MSPPESLDALSDLPPGDLAIAELKALVGEPLSRQTFYSVVRTIRNTAPDGKPWSLSKVDESIRRLTQKRVLVGDGTIAKGWRDRLTLRTLHRPGGKAVVSAVRRATPKSWREDTNYARWDPNESDDHLVRSVRLAALVDDRVTVERLLDILARTAGRHVGEFGLESLVLANCPRDISFLDGLSPALGDRVAATHVEAAIDEGVILAPADPLIDTLWARDRDWATAPLLDRALMRLDILAERPESARRRIARVRAWAPSAAVAAEAALEFLTGSAVDGLAGFRAALKLHRKAVGRRKTVLPQEFGVYHVLASIVARDATLRDETLALCGIMDETDAPAAPALHALVMLDAGRDESAKQWAGRIASRSGWVRARETPVDLAVSALALAVIDAPALRSREDLDWRAVQRWGAYARVAARVVAEAHASALPNPGVWQEALATYGAGYARRFMDVVPIRPAWDRALDRLQTFLAPPGGASTDPSAEKTRRLVFLFDSGTLETVPSEQTAKRDGWSAGRPVALKRLHDRDSKLDYLTAEDEKVLDTIATRIGTYGSSYVFDRLRTAAALIGHPRVFDAKEPDRRIELVGYPVELVVREAGDRLRLELSHPCSTPQVFVEQETPTRWRVIEVTPALVELNAILGPKGLEAPKEARERVVALVATDGARLPVRSELAGASGTVDNGDPRPVLQIAPEGSDFILRALVRPLGEDGPTYVPGVGARSVLASASGAHRRVNRDLAAETAALEAVAMACPALASWRESDQAWRIETLDGALEALQQLHEYEGALRLEWPAGAAIKPTRTVDAKAVSLNISAGRDWFEVKGKIRVDEDLVLDMAQVVARLGTMEGRFVALDDGRYLALTEDLRRRLEGFAAVTETVRGNHRIAAAGVGAVEDLVGAAGTVKTDARWRELQDKLAAAQQFEPALPSGFDADLRDYQMQGYVWLARLSRLGLGACLADDMGLGKTVQTLALLVNDAAKGPSLVIAPTSVCHNWVLEAARFAPGLRVHLLSAAADRAALIEGLGPGDVLVASYGLLHTEVEALAACRFAVAVFDEAQSLKNAETRRAQASKRIVADFRLGLSGTPVENRLEELWSLYDTIVPGLLGSRDSFHRRFASPIEKGHAGGQARQALKTLVRPFLLRRTKAAVLAELPPRTEITLEIEPGEAERAFYEALRRKALDNLAGAAGAGNQARIRILAEIMRLRRAACNPALVDASAGLESAKLAALLDLAAELVANRHRALVFSQFTGHLDLVEAALERTGVRLLRLDGSTPANERARRVAAFQAGEAELFLISLKAGGFGLNLTAADYVIHLDPWWNPAVEDQATDRAHRIGQTMPVTVYRLVMKDSIEEKILALHAEKRALTADFLDGADQAAALDEEALMALIRG